MMGSKYIQTQSRKMIGAFAGVGALVEDLKGVVKIQPIDKWTFFTTGKHLEPEYHIHDNRLLQRLKNKKGFPQLKALVQVPTNTTKNYSNQQYTQPTDWELVATAKYFPKWLFCSNCRRFKSLRDWWYKWDNTIQQYDSGNSNKAKEYFIPPKCGFCYEQVKKTKKGKWYIELTQVRFIMISSDGKISDVPWNKWTTFKDQAKDEEYGTIINYAKWNQCCNKQDLRYKQGDFEDLAGMSIHCEQCKKRRTLTGLHGLSYFSDQEKKHRYKMSMRSSNSVYYPILAHSLYLPSPSNNSRDSQGFEKELNYRRKEYQFLIDNSNYSHDNFIFTHQGTNNLKQYNIDYLIKVSRLKMTTVQTGYTRQQPLDIDLFLNDEIDNIKPQYTSTVAKNTEYLLGMENFGEGVFIVFNENIAQNYSLNKQQEVQNIFTRSKENALFKNHFRSVAHLAKFIAIHTFSHILMKELEFSCGYPTVSLRERLFVDDKEMHGVLIYTVGGMEGSYGGLVSQAKPDKFEQLLKDALERAKDCASDPICYHSEGQGVGQMNLAACHSCALVAENACEVFNSFLDRNVLPKFNR